MFVIRITYQKWIDIKQSKPFLKSGVVILLLINTKGLIPVSKLRLCVFYDINQ